MDEKNFRQTLRRAFWPPFAIGGALAAILILEVGEIESEWTDRDREFKMFGGPARTFLTPR